MRRHAAGDGCAVPPSAQTVIVIHLDDRGVVERHAPAAVRKCRRHLRPAQPVLPEIIFPAAYAGEMVPCGGQTGGVDRRRDERTSRPCSLGSQTAVLAREKGGKGAAHPDTSYLRTSLSHETCGRWGLRVVRRGKRGHRCLPDRPACGRLGWLADLPCSDAPAPTGTTRDLFQRHDRRGQGG
jgi:hypothetical protein